MTKRALVTGAGGFLGSHLVDHLLAEDYEVVGVDNFITGRKKNLEHLSNDSRFTFIEGDVSEELDYGSPFSVILHFASPASPPEYLKYPIETLRVGSVATDNLLQRARHDEARILVASTSEIYGDPLEHPQTESYWGNVNSIGPRSVYDEAKRYAEAITMAYNRTYGVDTRIVRIFNTYGPRMRPDDGRVVSNFIAQALKSEPITIYGDGSQTRSFCFVDDEVRGILGVLNSSSIEPVNVGNPNEFTVSELANLVTKVLNSTSEIVYLPLPQDDPTRRQPDISLIKKLSGWEPKTSLEDGVVKTAEYFQSSEGIS